jgi:hypothetical protein
MKAPFLFLAASLSLLLTVDARAQSPGNDEFSNSLIATGEIGTSTSNSTHATYEAGEPYEVEESAGRTLWWRWTASNAGRYVFHTTSSTFDTILAIYTGSTVNNLTLVDYNDEAMGGSLSRVTFDAVAGQTYHIQVDGWGTAGFGKVVLAWLPFPTMVYSWRNVWTTQGAEVDPDDNSIYWTPRSTSTFNGLVVRGRSTDVDIPRYGEEQGPIAFFYFSPVKVGARTVTYFQYTKTYPLLDSTDPQAPYFKGGFASLMSQYSDRTPVKANETAYLDELDNAGDYTFYTRVSGAASRKLPFPGAPRTWYASSLTGNVESYDLLDSGDFPDQGEPEFGFYQKSTDTLKFSAVHTSRVKGLGFDAAVEAMKLHLISKGFIEGSAP